MLTAQLMASMSDDHLVAAITAELDPLTSTAIETELLGRFETALEAQDAVRGFVNLQEEYEFTDEEVKAVIEAHPASLKDMAALLQLLSDNDIHEPDQLRDLIAQRDQFDTIASDAGDVFERLSQLITANQE